VPLLEQAPGAAASAAGQCFKQQNNCDNTALTASACVHTAQVNVAIRRTPGGGRGTYAPTALKKGACACVDSQQQQTAAAALAGLRIWGRALDTVAVLAVPFHTCDMHPHPPTCAVWCLSGDVLASIPVELVYKHMRSHGVLCSVCVVPCVFRAQVMCWRPFLLSWCTPPTSLLALALR
jgi:hypothetical protein